MKKQLLFIAMLLISGSLFAQATHVPKAGKDATAKTMKTSGAKGAETGRTDLSIVPTPAAQKLYYIALPPENWQYLFSVIRSSGKLTAVQAEDYIDAFNKSIRPVPDEPTDSTVKKKSP